MGRGKGDRKGYNFSNLHLYLFDKTDFAHSPFRLQNQVVSNLNKLSVVHKNKKIKIKINKKQ
jgi:hypothetical protein